MNSYYAILNESDIYYAILNESDISSDFAFISSDFALWIRYFTILRINFLAQ